MRVGISSRLVIIFSSLICGVLIIAPAGGIISQPLTSVQTDIPFVDHRIYLPLLHEEFPPVPSVFGIEYTNPITDSIQFMAKESGNYWLRWALFDWNKIEAIPDVYDWSSVPDEQIAKAVNKGMKIIATIKNVPAWARQSGGLVCGPIDSAALDDFAQFTKDVVTRYNGHIQYWELGNEPDVDPVLFTGDNPDPPYGCWGDESDAYYGGGYYATMLKEVYPQIKAVDPTAKVLIGGLLMDCDPTNPPVGKNCLPAKFFEGILLNDGAKYFDIVSFHGYPIYDGNQPIDENYEGWEERGGVVVGKIDYLREVMKLYNIDKPIIHSENSLLCPEYLPLICLLPSPDFFEDQADYVVKAYTRSMALGIEASIWYTFNNGGWRYGGMLDEKNAPRKAYDVYAYLISQLRKTQYLSEISAFSGVNGYIFTRPDNTQVWVLWTVDGTEKVIQLPDGTLRIFDKYGVEQIISPAISVSRPIYLEVTP